MKKYKYKGVTYSSVTEVRNAIFTEEGKAFASPPQSGINAFWAALGVSVEESLPDLSEATLSKQVRERRDRLLAECDYYVMPDYPSTETSLAEVKLYRQALRDITKQGGFPRTVSFPSTPTVLLTKE